MILEAWILMDKTLLDSLWAVAKGDDPPASLALLTNGVRDYWKDSGTDEVVNVIGTEEAINDFQTEHAAGIAAIYAWIQGPGLDNLDVYPTVPQGVLDLMLDFITYDGDGNPIGSTPPTFDTPNWGHVFLGQSERIFAGEFTDEFTQEFF